MKTKKKTVKRQNNKATKKSNAKTTTVKQSPKKPTGKAAGKRTSAKGKAKAPVKQTAKGKAAAKPKTAKTKTAGKTVIKASKPATKAKTGRKTTSKPKAKKQSKRATGGKSAAKSPTKTKSEHIGEIHRGNTKYIDKEPKPQRNYVVVNDNEGNITVAKVKTIRKFDANGKNADPHLQEINREKYGLENRSGVDSETFNRNSMTHNTLRLTDKDVFPEQKPRAKLSSHDSHRVLEHTNQIPKSKKNEVTLSYFVAENNILGVCGSEHSVERRQ
ncbi:MAG: hypothetical protein NC350_05710 [Corallococcus sp.]|nr:hypothetical protein [Corallococcus sp.]